MSFVFNGEILRNYFLLLVILRHVSAMLARSFKITTPKRHLRPILKRAGLPQIRLYDLRHTAATLALSSGVPIKVISEQLGHASSALTMDVYSHVSPDMQEEAVRKVEEKLRKFVERRDVSGSGDGKPM
jgi:integrase